MNKSATCVKWADASHGMYRGILAHTRLRSAAPTNLVHAYLYRILFPHPHIAFRLDIAVFPARGCSVYASCAGAPLLCDRRSYGNVFKTIRELKSRKWNFYRTRAIHVLKPMRDTSPIGTLSPTKRVYPFRATSTSTTFLVTCAPISSSVVRTTVWSTSKRLRMRRER